MKSLITGGAGFIGSTLADELLKSGGEVVVIDNLSTGRYENIIHLADNKKFQFIKDSILNETIMDELTAGVDQIYHLAAAVGVELIVNKPLESMTTNIRGSEIVLNAALKHNKKVLITSTSEIYGKNTNLPLNENSDRVLGPTLKTRWSYSTAKAVDEIMAYLYWKEKQVQTVIVRLFNTVGPRQTGSYGMVVPRFVKQALNHEDITIYGDGQQSRCFLFVGDTVNALIKLMAFPAAVGSVFNIGSQEEVTIEQLAQRILLLTNSRSKIVYIPYSEAYKEGFEDMQRRVPDTAKLKNAINFVPTKNLDGIILSVAEYLRPQRT